MERYSFTVTGYTGFEEEILRLRNANRDSAETRQYVDWRYAGLAGDPEPRVFWLRSKSGQAFGMSSLIFRPYWVNGVRTHFAVLGDISLDASLRGKGLAQELLHFVSRHVIERLGDCTAFVIPNDKAQRSLALVGWKSVGKLIPYIFPLKPENLLGRRTNSSLSRGASSLLRWVLFGVVRSHLREAYSMQLAAGVDDAFDALWNDVPKTGLILKDMGVASLSWRYLDHPHDQFRIAKFAKNEQFVGYAVYKISNADRTCHVHDVVLREPGELRPIIAMFVSHLDKCENLDKIRIVLSDEHPYGRTLWKMGFIRRRAAGTVQWLSSSNSEPLAQSTLAMTWGDKDI